MRILWVVNVIFPFPAQKIGLENPVFGGWLKSMFEEIIKFKDISKIAIVTVYNGKNFQTYINGNEVYYLIPSHNISKYTNKFPSAIFHLVELNHSFNYKKIILRSVEISV